MYVDENARELERLRTLVERLGEDMERGLPFSPSEFDPEDVDWINYASRPLIHAIAPRETAPLAVQIAEETDRRVASLPADRMWPNDSESPMNALRATHRGEHLDDIEAALKLTMTD